MVDSRASGESLGNETPSGYRGCPHPDTKATGWLVYIRYKLSVTNVNVSVVYVASESDVLWSPLMSEGRAEESPGLEIHTVLG